MATQDSRIKLKRSTVNSTVPTVPSSNDHTDGTWIATDIYKGELFYNQADGVLWTRGDSGIECIQGTAKLTIASADVLTLNTLEIDIVAAPGVGFAIELISASRKIQYGTTPYATNTTLAIASNASNFSMATCSINASISNIVSFEKATPPSATAEQLVENQPLQVYVETGDPTAGDSDITIYLTYRIITL